MCINKKEGTKQIDSYLDLFSDPGGANEPCADSVCAAGTNTLCDGGTCVCDVDNGFTLIVDDTCCK